jgi:hypothetical protein
MLPPLNHAGYLPGRQYDFLSTSINANPILNG